LRDARFTEEPNRVVIRQIANLANPDPLAFEIPHAPDVPGCHQSEEAFLVRAAEGDQRAVFGTRDHGLFEV
jgi:hypothetical protein